MPAVHRNGDLRHCVDPHPPFFAQTEVTNQSSVYVEGELISVVGDSVSANNTPPPPAHPRDHEYGGALLGSLPTLLHVSGNDENLETVFVEGIAISVVGDHALQDDMGIAGIDPPRSYNAHMDPSAVGGSDTVFAYI